MGNKVNTKENPMEMTYTYTVSRLENPQDKIEGTLSIGGVDVTKNRIAGQVLIVKIENIAEKADFNIYSDAVVLSVKDQNGLEVIEA
tara:strand:+ start:4453 stop:4713 length:261 start_codon:yes stop_codon:yes gene_type:complete